MRDGVRLLVLCEIATIGLSTIVQTVALSVRQNVQNDLRR
jgi:hypothetical protein